MPRRKIVEEEKIIVPKNPPTTNNWVLQIFILFLGIVLGVLFSQVDLKTELSFSPVDLINFAFSIALAAASIVLAITAILLGKKSEDVITNSQREGTRFQHELFVKTLTVLSRIETSSGTTEKRVEDITKEIKAYTNPRTRQDTKEIEEIVREGLSPTFSTEEQQKRREERMVRLTEKNKFQNDVLVGVGNIENVKTIKAGEGYFGGDLAGENLVDGLYEVNGKHFSVSVFYTLSKESFRDVWLSDMSEYVSSLASEISKNTFVKCFLVLNMSSQESELKQAVEEAVRPYRDEVRENIQVFTGSPEEIVAKLKKELPGP